jgi:hypothetical protein
MHPLLEEEIILLVGPDQVLADQSNVVHDDIDLFLGEGVRR